MSAARSTIVRVMRGFFDCHVAVREAAPLLFLVFCSEDKLLCRLKQVLEIFRNRLASGMSRE